jgi:hypothetical protein
MYCRIEANKPLGEREIHPAMRAFRHPAHPNSYSSWRLKISSFSRWEQFEHPRQEKRSTATPTVTMVAMMLALEMNQ